MEPFDKLVSMNLAAIPTAWLLLPRPLLAFAFDKEEEELELELELEVESASFLAPLLDLPLLLAVEDELWSFVVLLFLLSLVDVSDRDRLLLPLLFRLFAEFEELDELFVLLCDEVR